jgi:UDPglucose--hexose-1-phosphate uridylyltransferase
MPQLRRDPFTRSWVIIAPERADRPLQMPAAQNRAAPTDPQCPFCPGREASTPPELWRLPGPAGDWTVRVVPNRYPILTPGDRPARHYTEGLFTHADATGHHEVVIESPRHDWDLPDGDDAAVTAVLHAYRARAQMLRVRRPGVVLPFRNHGAAAGTSLPHPHSQIVATPIVPARQRELFDVARGYYDDHASCLYVDVTDAELADGRRLVATGEHVVAYAPYAARTPYETWLMPRVHAASFADTTDEVLAETAALLRRVLAGLRELLGDVPYNYVLISASNGEEDTEYFLWHIQILPRLVETAGFELGSGMAVNPVPPEDAATRLRKAVAEVA